VKFGYYQAVGWFDGWLVGWKPTIKLTNQQTFLVLACPDKGI
jgi:hypothetical protein